MSENPDLELPQPDPALKRLDRLVGSWIMEGNLQLDATFTGSWRDDDTFSGGWRPNPGADETANPPYDISARRVG
jgi:hypothetical protein